MQKTYRYGFWLCYILFLCSLMLWVSMPKCPCPASGAGPVASAPSGTFCMDYSQLKAWCSDSCEAHFPGGNRSVKLYMNDPHVMICSCLAPPVGDGMQEKYSPTETVYC